MILLFFSSSYAAAYVFSLLTEARTAALRDWLTDHIPQVKLRGPAAADPGSPEQVAEPSAATDIQSRAIEHAERTLVV